jgi:hypothetical protein
MEVQYLSTAAHLALLYSMVVPDSMKIFETFVDLRFVFLINLPVVDSAQRILRRMSIVEDNS